jgi:DNA-binding protein HU-beta
MTPLACVTSEGACNNNADLAEQIAAAHGLSKADARKIVDDLFSAITDVANKGGEVSLAGFGKFKLKESAAREGRNPATGATIQIAAARKLGFAPAKAVKERLNGGGKCPSRRAGTHRPTPISRLIHRLSTALFRSLKWR